MQDIEIDSVTQNDIDIPLITTKKEESEESLSDKDTNKNVLIFKENNSKNDSLQNQKVLDYKKKFLKERSSFYGFNGPISSIAQSRLNGNILVTCYDGNVYLLTPPNLELYLSNNTDNKDNLN